MLMGVRVFVRDHPRDDPDAPLFKSILDPLEVVGLQDRCHHPRIHGDRHIHRHSLDSNGPVLVAQDMTELNGDPEELSGRGGGLYGDDQHLLRLEPGHDYPSLRLVQRQHIPISHDGAPPEAYPERGALVGDGPEPTLLCTPPEAYPERGALVGDGPEPTLLCLRRRELYRFRTTLRLPP